MGRSKGTALAFALAAGLPRDARAVFHVDPHPIGDRRLLATMEPAAASERSTAVAETALGALRDAVAAAADLPVVDALERGLAAANAAVRDANQPGCCRVLVGATAILIQGRTLTIAQVPPSQAIVVQEDQLFAFPDLATWCPKYEPAEDEIVPEPLGAGDEVRPLLYRTVFGAGDLVLLSSTALACCLARDATNGVDVTATSCGPLLSGSAELALDWLETIVVAHALDDVHAACLTLERPPLDFGPASELVSRLGGVSLRPTRERRAIADDLVIGGPLGVGAAGRRAALATVGIPLDRDLVLDAANGDEGESPEGGGGPGAEVDGDAAALGAGLIGNGAGSTYLPEGAVLAMAMAQTRDRTVVPEDLPPVLADGALVGPRLQRARLLDRVQTAFINASERIGPRRDGPRLPFDARSRSDVVLGLGSVRCYRDTMVWPLPLEWRTRLPRGMSLRIPARVALVLLVLLVAFGASGMVYNYRQAQAARVETYLATVDSHLLSAAQVTDPAAIEEELTLAQGALEGAARNGAGAGELAARRSALEAAHDEVRNVLRLSAVNRVGSLPPALRDRPVKLIRAGRDVFLVGGGLYQVDDDAGTLVRFLAPGDRVAGGRVGDLIDGAADRGTIVVTDGEAVYARDDTGTWVRQPLGLTEGQRSDVTTCGLFQGGVYFLAPDVGQILKFPDAKLDELPEQWAELEASAQLTGARDMVIDGTIYVLQADGRIVSLYRGQARTELTPAARPAITAPLALYGASDTGFLYVADASVDAGRIVRLDRHGDAIQQYMLPSPEGDDAAGGFPLAELRDFVVDELTGTLYFVTSDAIWSASFSG